MTSNQDSENPPVVRIDADVKHSSIGKLARSNVLLLLLCVFGVLSFVTFGSFGVYVVISQNDTNNTVQQLINHELIDLHCISDWATAFTTRTQLLLQASTARSDALDQVVRVVAKSKQAPGEFQAALKAYILASDRYDQIVHDTPIPQAPQFTCFTNRH